MRIWVKNFGYHKNKGYQFFETEICTDKTAMNIEDDFKSSTEFASMSEIRVLEDNIEIVNKMRDNLHDEIKALQAKLKIAKEALDGLKNDYSFGNGCVYRDIEKALKEINK